MQGGVYAAALGLHLLSLQAEADGVLDLRSTYNLCLGRYPVAFYAGGERSNTLYYEVTSSLEGCSYGCIEVVRDRQYHCPYHPLRRDRHNIVFTDARTQRILAADVTRPDGPADVVLTPFHEFGWSQRGMSPSPDLQKMLVTRERWGCPSAPETPPGPGLECSYGRMTLWLAVRAPGKGSDPDDDRWVHLNLAPLYGLNSFGMDYSTWLNDRLALFSALVLQDDEQFQSTPAAFNPQILAIGFSASGLPSSISPFAREQLERDHCLTGRVHAMPSSRSDGCSDGQKIIFTRRCFDEPHTPETWSWWNSTSPYSPRSRCRPDMGQFEIPVLRAYVAELDASCSPKRKFEQMRPVREPPAASLYRQIGTFPEWGDMSPAISPDGLYVAVATLMGNPFADPDTPCLGFFYHLMNPDDPMSGTSGRRTHLCELDPSDLTCKGPLDEMAQLTAWLRPPETSVNPVFIRTGERMTLAVARYWSLYQQPRLWGILRVDQFPGSPQLFTDLKFAPGAAFIAAIAPTPQAGP